jgi:hypothetical protein
MNKAAHQKLNILVNNKPALQTRRKLAKNTQDRPTVGHKKQLSKTQHQTALKNKVDKTNAYMPNFNYIDFQKQL